MTGQAQFTAALLDPFLPLPQGLVSPRDTPDAKRFAIYRNNVHVGLVAALAVRFPVTRQVVGEEFFTAMARTYVGRNKPATPVMLHYGNDFAAYVGAFPPAAPLPYLPDLARLEAAWSDVYNAADIALVTPDWLASLAPGALAGLRLRPAPSARLIVSDFAVGSIWSAHQRSPFVPPSATGAENVLVTRPGAEVRLTVISAADAAFWHAMVAGGSVPDAADAVLARHAGFDPGSALVGLVRLGAFMALDEGARS